jgi:hypothetical protein
MLDITTYADIIAATKIHDVFGQDVHFEIYREDRKPPLTHHFEGSTTAD